MIITIMVLELKAPEEDAAFSALLPLWPTAVSYAISYLFIAIIWFNHHHLLRFVKHVTPAVIRVNSVHLFFVSLVPFTQRPGSRGAISHRRPLHFMLRSLSALTSRIVCSNGRRSIRLILRKFQNAFGASRAGARWSPC